MLVDENSLTILLIDNDEKFHAVARAMMEKDTHIDCVSTLDDAETVLNNGGQYDAVVLSLDLVTTRGLNTLRKFKRINSQIPLVVLSEARESELKDSAERLGASDYISKSNVVEMSPLTRSVRRAVNTRICVMHESLDIALGKLSDSGLKLAQSNERATNVG